ncbi:MAG TPA: hypothetical protein VKX45_21970 [Bryobacteraceae bacterium]|jgi:uncharacterized protein (TIGR03437 family)|nr:hypothetical protein [Bryobacteraceae bacterium]
MIDTVAGGYMPNGVPAAGVELISTNGITGDAQGNIYFLDSRRLIRRIRRDGTIETIAGNGVTSMTGDGGPAAAASLLNPAKLTCDAAGNIYFFDTARIRRVGPSGTITTVAGTGIYGSLGTDGPATLAQIDPPGDLAAGKDGAVYFSETRENRVRKVTPDGHIALVAGNLTGPSALAADQSGNIFVAEANQNIRRIAPDGTISAFASGFTYVQALAAGPQGTLYVGDCTFNYVTGSAGGPCQIRRVAPDGTVQTLAGSSDPASSLTGPAASVAIGAFTGLFADATENVYIADTGNLIRRLTPQATVETVAGVQMVAGAAPVFAPDRQDARQAWLTDPFGISLDRSGNLYIAELCMIRKVAPGGAFTTIAGTGKCANAAQEGPVGTTDLPYLYDLAVTSQGQVYAADQSGDLLSIAPGKTVALVQGIGGTGYLMRLAIDSQDRLYILSGGKVMRLQAGASPEIYVYPIGGTVNRALGPNAVMAIDGADNLYIASGPNGSLTEALLSISPKGAVLSDGFLSASDLKATLPLDSIAVDITGRIYGTNHSLVGFDIYPGGGFKGDGGPLASALTNLASRLVAAPSGDFYFLDLNNRRVRKITSSPPTVAPTFSAAGVVNAASGIAGPVAPGELVSIYGANLGPASGWINAPENNVYPGVAGYTKVLLGPAGTFSNGSPMAMLLATTNQVNAFIPYSISGAATISARVETDGLLSVPITLNVATSAFGLFTANSSGSGQGAILNQDGSYNSAANPAPRGSIVSLYGTGDGLESPTPGAGTLVLSTPYPAPAASVTVMIGGQPADVSYAGAAPFLPAGITQINARIPQGIAPGDASIVVSIGGLPTTQAVTVAVK